MKSYVKRTMSSVVRGTLGRRHMARLGRFLYNEACLSPGNDPEFNGELLVQDVISAWARTVPPPFTVVDAGANVGAWTRTFADRLSKAGVTAAFHLFEPFPGTFATLCGNLSRWGLGPGVVPHNVALSSECGEHAFHSLGSGVGVNSLYPIDGADATARTMITRTTLDAACAAAGVSDVHFLKIDTEGHDFDVLRGAQAVLAAGRVRFIQFEYNHRWVIARRFLRDVFEFLTPYGYRIGKETRLGIEFYDRWHPELESFHEDNYLAVLEADAELFPVVPWWNA